MRSDAEIERQIEDWLEAEARAIPRDVLEDALEAVSRTSQEGSRSPAVAWLRRPMGLLGAAAVLVLLVSAGALTVSRIGSFLPTQTPSGGPVQAWDPSIDLALRSGRLNPSPDSYGDPAVWSYKSGALIHTPVAYELLPAFVAPRWSDPRFLNLSANLDATGVVLSPWKGPSSERFVMLAWKSPIDGSVSIRGTFALVDDLCTGSGITFYVDHDADSLFESQIPTGGHDAFDLHATVARGESLYFVVGAGATSTCDSTLVTLTITGS
jgi:hypothetical protein